MLGFLAQLQRVQNTAARLVPAT